MSVSAEMNFLKIASSFWLKNISLSDKFKLFLVLQMALGIFGFPEHLVEAALLRLDEREGLEPEEDWFVENLGILGTGYVINTSSFE